MLNVGVNSRAPDITSIFKAVKEKVIVVRNMNANPSSVYDGMGIVVL